MAQAHEAGFVTIKQTPGDTTVHLVLEIGESRADTSLFLESKHP